MTGEVVAVLLVAVSSYDEVLEARDSLLVRIHNGWHETTPHEMLEMATNGYASPPCSVL